MVRKPSVKIAAGVYFPPRASQPWRLDRLLRGQAVRYYGYARYALIEALKSAKVAAGEAVLIPELICRDVLFSLHAVGAKPLFYPVDKRLEPEGPLPSARVALAVDYFGFPQDLAPFKDVPVVIEDNAHGLFSRDAEGRWLGTRADFGLFSMRKTVALPNGGALAMPLDSRFAIPAQIAFTAKAGLRHRVLGSLRRVAAPFGHRPARALQKAWRALKGGAEYGFSGPAGETGFSLPPQPCAELSRPLRVADAAREIRRRRVIYSMSEGVVVNAGGRPVFPELPNGVAPYVFPFYADAWRIDAIRRALHAQGLDAFPWPELPAAVEPSAPPHYKGLWCVRFLW